MFDFLSKKLTSIFSRFSKDGRVTKEVVQDILNQVSNALLEADVPHELVETFAREVAEDITGQKVTTSLKPAEHLLKVIHDRIVSFIGGKSGGALALRFPTTVMVMGLQGSGKTTTIGKLAHHIAEKEKKRVLVGSVDFYRPAAIEQLEIVAQKAGVDFYRSDNSDPVQAAHAIYAHYQSKKYDALLLDTAGRLHVDAGMLEELQKIDALVRPEHKLLVLDSMTGQESFAVARAFEKGVGFEGAVLSKMDSDARGGAAFSFRYALNKPIFFIGTGENVDNLEPFHAERIAGRMLGMGDLKTLLDRAGEKIKKSEQERMEKSLLADRMTFEQFADQMNMLSRLGSLSQIMKYMPGNMTAGISDSVLEQGEKELKCFKAIIGSMTKRERTGLISLNSSRKERIARGAGVGVSDVNNLVKRFELAQQYVKLMKKSGPFKALFR